MADTAAPEPDDDLLALAFAWPGERAIITSLAAGSAPGEIERVALL